MFDPGSPAGDAAPRHPGANQIRLGPDHPQVEHGLGKVLSGGVQGKTSGCILRLLQIPLVSNTNTTVRSSGSMSRGTIFA